MAQDLPASMLYVLFALALFLIFAVALTYTRHSNFARTRWVMTTFFLFVVFTLTVSFWHIAALTVPYTAPAFVIGLIAGHVLGVKAAKERIRIEGVAYYMEHFAHIHLHHLRSLSWWSVINFYTIMAGLLLINLVGLSNVLFRDIRSLGILTCVVGAFLIGTIVPYLMHLWRIRSR